MNIYFLKDTEDDFIMWIITAKSMKDMEGILNHYLTNLCEVTDYVREAKLSDQEESQFYIRVYDQFKDDPNKFLSGEYVVLERQYSPDRVYDLV